MSARETVRRMLATANAVAAVRPRVPDTPLVADMKAMRAGWIRYDGGRLVGISTCVLGTVRHPLPRPPDDGWEPVASVELVDPDNGEIFTLRTRGAGVRTIRQLSRAYGAHRRKDRNALPVVRLIHIAGQPTFEIVGWH